MVQFLRVWEEIGYLSDIEGLSQQGNLYNFMG